MNLVTIFRFHETKLASVSGIIFPAIFTDGSQTHPPLQLVLYGPHYICILCI